ncbi:MAG: AraC family transcriptional regulator [Luteibacter sp.]
MIDPLAEVVTLLQPRPTFSKAVGAAGHWRVRRSQAGHPFYCVVLDGVCRMETNGLAPMVLEAGDFVLVPEAYDFAMSSLEPPAVDVPDTLPVALADGRFRLGRLDGPADVDYLVGQCALGSPDAALLVSLLPDVIRVRGERRLATLVGLLRDESRAERPARDVVLAHLLELLFIEALRSTGTGTSPGLVRGLTDVRLALALRQMHEHPDKPWTVVQLANIAALSRSVFFERFSRAVGVSPMEYLLSWRMALAKSLLRARDMGIATIAERVGYRSASAFSVAFTRHVGLPPSRYMGQPMDERMTGV